MAKNENDMIHRCTLRLRDTKPALPTLRPGVNCFKKCFRFIQRMTLLNEKDIRCKTLLKTASARKNEKKRHARSKYWYIIHPFSKLNHYIEIIFLLSIMHRWIFLMHTLKRSYFDYVISCCRDILHVIIMISFFMTGYVKVSTKEIFIHPKQTIKHYLLTFFIFDLILLLEQSYFFKIIDIINYLRRADNQLSSDNVFAPLCILSLIIYLIRSKSVVHVITDAAKCAGCGKTAIYIIEQFITLIFILHFYTYMLFAVPFNHYVVENQVPHDSWISIRKLTITEYTLNTYFEGLVIVLSYFFGCYHYDTFQRPIEQVLLFFFGFTGRFFVLLIIGRVLSNFGFDTRADAQYENMLIQLNSYMRSYQVPIEIQEQITEKFEYNYKRKYFNAQQMMMILSEHLKTEMFLFGAKSLIYKNPVLKNLKTNEIAFLFAHMKSTIFSKHEIILGGLQTSNRIYFILSGTVAAYCRGMEVFHANDGEVFGLTFLFPSLSAPPQWFIMAVETTEVYFIHKKRLQMFILTRPEVKKYFYSVYEERIIKAQYLMRQKFEGGENIRELLRKGVVLEKPKKRENDDYDYDYDLNITEF